VKRKRYRFGGEDREQLPSGDKRLARLAAEAQCRARIPERRKLAKALASLRGAQRSAVGLKRWFVPGTEFEGQGVTTPYAAKELRRRRAASRVAKASRKRNRRTR